METKIYNPKTLSERLGIGRQLAYRLLRSGKIHAVRAGDLWLTTEIHVQAYLDSSGDQKKAG